QRRLQRAQLLGQTGAQLEEALVHRPQLAAERAPGRLALCRRIGGHASCHRDASFWRLRSMPSARAPAPRLLDFPTPRNTIPEPMTTIQRPSGRTPAQLRQVRLERGYTRHAEGSVLVSFGDTRVLCTASVE